VPFSKEQIEQLQARLDDSRVHTRRKQGIELRYLEGHDVIDTANAVFGFHAWSYNVRRLELTAGVWMAVVAVTVLTPEGEAITREDVGVGIPLFGRDQLDGNPDAQEMAIKGAVTDALKRAMRTFGNAFGNGLYDKSDGAGTNSAARSDEPAPLRPAHTESDEESRLCPSCDQPMILRSGTTRDGRPYSAWFCSAKCGQKPFWLTERKAS
jgi:DNA recombination protein Rad52